MTGQLTQPATSPPSPAEDTYAFPLSFAQQRLWFLDRLEGESSPYVIPLVVRLRGRLDLDALENALSQLVARHEVLRTVFAERDGTPVQIVSSTLDVQVPLVDVRHADDPEAEALTLAGEEANQPFDLAAGPVLRARLFRLGEDDHLLALVVHHIAADGWSTGVLFRDLGEFYAARVEERKPGLADLDVQYADFAVWQREWLQGDRLEEQLDFWRKHLDGASTVLELPSDRPRPAKQSLRGGHVRTVLPLELRKGLEGLGRTEGATLFMTLLAAFAAVLSRYSGQEDVLIGTPIANRTRVDLEQLIGFFANTLVLRSNLSGNPTFREVLARTREVTLDAFAHQDLPFEKLVEELNPERALSHSPLFQVLFALQNVEGRRLELPGLRLSSVELEREIAKFDLALFVSECPEGLRASLEYAVDLFDAHRVERLMGHLRTFLEAVVADPDRRVGEVPLLTEAERLSLAAWNETAVTHEWAGLRVHELVEARASRTPDTAALVFGEQTLTYAQLDAQANRLAHRLRSLGVGADVPVGIFMYRSLETLVAVLAVLKAGGAYAPLDPTYPRDRLAFMLEEAAPPVLLTQRSLAAALPRHGAHLLVLDEDETWEGGSDEPLEPVGSPDSLAYVLYTSGSTGRPKGVAMPHRPLVNLLWWQLGSWTPPAAARTLQFASLSFDVAFQEIFSTWCAGGTLLLVDEDARRDPEALLRLLRKQAVERLFLPFVALDHIAAASLHLGVLPERLREVMTAGEALVSTPPIREFFERLDGCVLHNHYGPTESHVVTSFTLEGPPAEWPDRPPIGRPIANARIHLLDGCLQPVPVGVPGELFIGGPVLAHGYLKRPDLTAERFFPDPFSHEPDARIYRTGDVARYRLDGQIEYLGRADNQVKVRGYRVELGEIESVLLRHPRLREALAVVREDRPGDRRLVAYLVAGEEAQPGAAELRELLRSTLPEHMVPSSLVFVDALPLGPNGKVDRRVLPVPNSQAPLEAYVAARTDTERALAEIWQRLLGLDAPVDVHDDFFDLGGHSLLAVRLFAEIERVLKVRLPLALVFQGATVESLAAAVETERDSTEPWSALVPLQPAGSRPPLFLLHGIGGKLLLYRHLLRHLARDQPVYGIQPVGLDGRRAMHTHFRDMASHYVREIRRLQPQGPYLLGGLCYSGVLAYEMSRQLAEQGDEVALLALFDATPYGNRPSRLELERRKVADFLGGDLRDKAAWLKRRARGLRYKASVGTRLAVYRGLSRARLPAPEGLIDPSTVGRAAMRAYETPPSPVRVTLFRPSSDGTVVPGPSRWTVLAQGGVDLRPVVADAIEHANMLRDPYARVLADELEAVLGEVLARPGEAGERA